MEGAKFTQKEYLQKYLTAGNCEAKKRKKKKQKIVTKTVKIIDDDINAKVMRPIEIDDFEIFNTSEDAPQIVGVVDERGSVDFADRKRWKIIADDGEGNIVCSVIAHYQRDTHGPTFDEGTPVEKMQCQGKDKTSNSSKVLGDKSSLDQTDFHLSRKSKDKEFPEKFASYKHSHGVSNYAQDSQLSSLGKSRNASNSGLSLSRLLKHTRKSSKRVDGNLSTLRTSELNRKKSSKKPTKNFSTELSSSNSSGSNLSCWNKTQGYRDEKSNSKAALSCPRMYDSDLSPPREVRKHQNIAREILSQCSIETLRKSDGSDSDLSLPRASSKRSGGSKGNLPLQKQNAVKHDGQRLRSRDEEDAIFSPLKKQRSKSPRQSALRLNDNRPRKSTNLIALDKVDDVRMKKTLDGRTAGLQDARALRIETEAHKKHEMEMFEKMRADVSGTEQTAVLRDRRTGRKRDLTAEAIEFRMKEKRQDGIDEKYAKWGKGLKQVNDRAEQIERDAYEMNKPLARYADDADLEKELREVMRVGDPMLEYIKNKQIEEGKRKPERPSYQGTYTPNRFGIKPGHRWDGVDRSNGYEKKWFDGCNARRALQEEAYKWSTADM